MAMIVNGRGYVGINRSNPNRPNTIITDGLKLYLDAGNPTSYPGTGTVWTDISGNGNNGTLINGPTYSSVNSGSIVFDGTNDYGLVNYALNAPFTVTLWFKQTSLLTRAILETAPIGTVVNNVPTLLIRSASGTLQTYSNNNGYKTVSAYLTNTWYCLTVTRTATSENAYLNGVLKIDNQLAGGGSNGVINIGIGYGGYFNGNISNVQVYNRVLSASEVLQNYNALKSRYGLL